MTDRYSQPRWGVGMLLAVLTLTPVLGLSQQSYEISFTHDGKTAFGTFVTPDGLGPFPTIVFVEGSGPNDRNGTLPMLGANVKCLYPGLLSDTLRPYKEMAEALVDSGFAVLRYDKLEYTYNAQQLGEITFHKLWLPVESAIEFIRTRPDVDTNHIILLGHSEGSSIIPLVAKERNDIRALISVAGPRTPFDSLLAKQIINLSWICRGDTTSAHLQTTQILAYYNAIRTQTWSTATPAFFGASPQVWFDYLLATDPVANNYDSAGLPTLFIGFEEDINVPPSELNRFKHDVAITNDFWLLPDLTHFMTPHNNPHVAKTLSDTIVYWLRQQGLLKRVSSVTVHVEVTPNAFNREVSVSIQGRPFPHGRISITDLKGLGLYRSELDISGDSTSVLLDLSSLPKGSYYLHISGTGGSVVRQIVLQ